MKVSFGSRSKVASTTPIAGKPAQTEKQSPILSSRPMLHRSLLAAAVCILLAASAGASPLLEAAESGDTKKVQELLTAHPDGVDIEDEEGETSLMEAAEEGHLEIIELLLKGGAHINHQDHAGETALMEAAQESKLECVKLLLRKGAALGILDADGLGVLQHTKDEAIAQLLRNRGAR